MASKLIFGEPFLVLAMLCACQAACPANSPYLKLSPTHTRCREDRGKDIPLTTADIKAIVDKHNEIRAAVSPPAANMQKMVWDEDLAETAAKRARFCARGHEAYKDRAEPKLPFVAIGQNIAAYTDFAGLMNAISNSHKKGWLDEKADFTYGQATTKTVGHYTQMITATTRLIGCGMADCSAADKTYKQQIVCNYAVGQSSYLTPYTKAPTSCSACPGKCVKKLCDEFNTPSQPRSADGCPADKDSCAYWWQFPTPCKYNFVLANCPNRCRLCG